MFIHIVTKSEIRLHPMEFAFIDKDICNSLSKTSELEASLSTSPSPYFQLKPKCETSREPRLNKYTKKFGCS